MYKLEHADIGLRKEEIDCIQIRECPSSHELESDKHISIAAVCTTGMPSVSHLYHSRNQRMCVINRV